MRNKQGEGEALETSSDKQAAQFAGDLPDAPDPTLVINTCIMADKVMGQETNKQPDSHHRKEYSRTKRAKRIAIFILSD